MEEIRNMYKTLARNPKGKRQLGMSRWNDNIKIDLKEKCMKM
jgi:hypothetical protein